MSKKLDALESDTEAFVDFVVKQLNSGGDINEIHLLNKLQTLRNFDLAKYRCANLVLQISSQVKDIEIY